MKIVGRTQWNVGTLQILLFNDFWKNLIMVPSFSKIFWVSKVLSVVETSVIIILMLFFLYVIQPPRGICSKYAANMQQIYGRTPMLKCDKQFYWNHTSTWVLSLKLSNFIEITLWHGCSPVNLLQSPFSKNSSGWLLPYTGKPNYFLL